jgi:hypothetical protein
MFGIVQKVVRFAHIKTTQNKNHGSNLPYFTHARSGCSELYRLEI